MHNTYTYRHSELPSLRPEIQAEIVALDVQLADLILKSQGNYRELQQLAEVLDNCLDICQLIPFLQKYATIRLKRVKMIL
jgi:hypothetical protein